MKRSSISVLLASLALLFGCGNEVTVNYEEAEGHAHGPDTHTHDDEGGQSEGPEGEGGPA